MPAASTTGDSQPRFTPSKECHLPPTTPLSPTETSTLEALRSHIHDNVAKTDAQKAWADDACLIRYLKGRKWNLAEAKTALQETITWRAEYQPARLDRDGLWIETAPGKLYISGFDMESRPLLYMKPRLENTAASPAHIRHVCFHLEVAIALMPPGVGNLAIVIDFSGSSMRTNPGVAVAREIINVLGSHYPERLGKAYIIHAPWFFFPFYKLIGPFLDPVTKSKINFVDMKKQKPRSLKSSSSTPSSSASTLEVNNDAVSVKSAATSATASKAGTAAPDSDINLLDMIPADMLERAFGGTSDYVYNQDAYWEAVEQLLASQQ